MLAVIERWTQFIKDYSYFKNNILNNAFADEEGNVRSVAEQYELLKNAVEGTSEAYAWMKQTSEAAESAVRQTNGGMFDDDITRDIGNFTNNDGDYGVLIYTVQGRLN